MLLEHVIIEIIIRQNTLEEIRDYCKSKSVQNKYDLNFTRFYYKKRENGRGQFQCC